VLIDRWQLPLVPVKPAKSFLNKQDAGSKAQIERMYFWFALAKP
jgi:hypothetical protein